ncbi:hypothetical protein [Neptuniibacter sp. QD37_11]|uniref:hypothetical protein n=1 Tax=Neptuniibacter sp. QD37_11 TaxID=3398209 RepID=UPI0039F5D50A
MADYELYICAYKCGCKTLLTFSCSDDAEAVEKANAAIWAYEDEANDEIYRERLYKRVAGEQIELSL